MRAYTFQSSDIAYTLMSGIDYIPDKSKARECRYIDVPKVWVFCNDVTTDAFREGETMERWRCEMSLRRNSGLETLTLIECEVPDNLPVGDYHNAYLYARTLDTLSASSVKAVYQVSNTRHWYYKKLTPIYKVSEDVSWPDGIDFFQLNIANTKTFLEDVNETDVLDLPDTDSCCVCGIKTIKGYQGNHVCSKECLSIMKQALFGDIPHKVIQDIMSTYRIEAEEAISKVRNRPQLLMYFM